jgi:hypothetical protein
MRKTLPGNIGDIRNSHEAIAESQDTICSGHYAEVVLVEKSIQEANEDCRYMGFEKAHGFLHENAID